MATPRRSRWLAALLPMAAACTAAPAAETPDDLRALWERGEPYGAFEEGARARRDAWVGNHERARVPEALAARADALEGTWRLLVVAVDRCGDSANTIPYLARLVEGADALEMRVIDPDAGRALMEAHRTPDGRAATPTVVVLDEGFRIAGCWVERPTTLQRWFLENPEGLDEDSLYARKYAWYDEDAGVSTMGEVLDAVEGAARGVPVCGDA